MADLPGGQLGSEEQLARALSPEHRRLDALRGFSFGPVGVQLDSLPPGPVSSALERAVRRRPLLILIDEAHMLGVEPGRALLDTVQAFQRRNLAVLLILAGTPDLPRHLSSMGASFWDRSEQLPLGRLEPIAAADAVRVPFQEHGRSIDNKALQQVVGESHGYPFFLQFWGAALWEGCPDPTVPVSLADVDRARPSFERRRELYYDRRLDELDGAELVSVAASVAATFSSAKQVPRERVKIAIRSALEQKGEGKAPDPAAVREAERALRHRGFIWPVVRQHIGYYEPGIPSLMGHVMLNEMKNREIRGEAA